MAVMIIAFSSLLGLCCSRWAKLYACAIVNNNNADAKTLCIALLQIKHKDFIFFRDTLWALGFAVINAWLLLIKADWYLLLLCNGLLLLALIDYFSGLLPDILTLPLMFIAWLSSPMGLINASSSSALMAAMLYLAASLYLFVRRQYGFGGGDIKLLAAIAGWYGLTVSLQILLMASILALLLILFIGVPKGGVFVFGPFIAIATIAQILI